MKTAEVTDRMGIYTSLDEVPTGRRLPRFEAEFSGRELWSEFVEAEWPDRGEYKSKSLGIARRSWKSHVEDRGRHPALVEPEDVESWMQKVIQGRADSTVYRHYWIGVEQFYDWLVWHTDFPHVYNPLWMAVAMYPDGAVQVPWRFKVREGGADE